MYFMWFDDAPKKAFASKVSEGMAAYTMRFGFAPTVVIISMEDGAELSEIMGMKVRAQVNIRKNNIWFGMN